MQLFKEQQEGSLLGLKAENGAENVSVLWADTPIKVIFPWLVIYS